MIEASLETYLKNNAGIAALVASRIYPQLIPENPTYPAISYEKTSGEHERSLTGSSGLAMADFELECWAKTYGGAKSVADAVRNALDGFSGMMGTDAVSEVHLDSDSDLFEISAGNEMQRLYGVQLSLTIWYRESIPTLT
jgi:uncharacterized protein DUF3168